MARYIDADNFRKTMIKRFGCIPCLTDYSEASRYDIPLDDALNLAPTADVVPKKAIAEHEQHVKTEYARKIFEEIETCMKNFEDDDGYLLKKCEFEFFMRELKKKHTEEKE